MQRQSSISSSAQSHDTDEISDPALTTFTNRPSIKPPPFQFFLNNKEVILGKKKFSKSLLTHLKTSKSTCLPTTYDLSDRLYTKACQRIFTAQNQLTNFSCLLQSHKHFTNRHLLSTIRHFSSLSSLTMIFGSDSKKKSIPEETLLKSLASLKNLNHLDLSFLCLTFDQTDFLKNLMKTIRKAPKISNLSLLFADYDRLSSSHYNLFLSTLLKLNHLRTLKFIFWDSKDLLNTDIKTFISLLPRFSLLTKIDLSFGTSGQRLVQGCTLVNLFKAFQRMKNLVEFGFNMQGCDLVFEDSDEYLLQSLNCLAGSSIKRLNLGLFKNFSNGNLRELSEGLKELTLLKSLCLFICQGCPLTDGYIAEFGSVLACFTSLTSLRLSLPSGLTNKNIVETIASALRSLQNLVYLQFDFRFDNETEDQQFQALFSTFKSFKSLKYLDINIRYQKKITDTSLEVLGESLKDLNILKSFQLELSYVPLITNKGVEAICSGIQKSLSHLFLLGLKFDYNGNVNEKVLHKIGKTLQSLFFLYSVGLGFGTCLNVVDFKDFFNQLREMKNIQEIRVSLADSEVNRKALECFHNVDNGFVIFFKKNRN